MNRLSNLTMVETSQQRSELIRILASGVIRVLLKRKSLEKSELTETEPETFTDGLEDS
jgi:hypothetical protein